MWDAFFWGALATSSLILGGIIGSRFTFSHRVLGIIMAFGAGTLISAVSYELVYEAVRLGRGTGFPAFGLFAGALTFYLSEILINKYKPGRQTGKEVSQSGLLIPMVLAIILDGIPESIVIGLSIFEGGAVSMAMLVAVFISNLPEAIAGTTGMKSAGWSRGKIALLWIIIAIVCSFASMAGYGLFSRASDHWLSFIQAFAGGAILIMLANSMIPESYERGGKPAGLFTILGFSASVLVIVLENT